MKYLPSENLPIQPTGFAGKQEIGEHGNMANVKRVLKMNDTKNNWILLSEELPPEYVSVETKIDGNCGLRSQMFLTRVGNLFFTENMYVYYTPTHWRYK